MPHDFVLPGLGLALATSATLAFSGCSHPGQQQASQSHLPIDPLTQGITALDSAVLEAFNACKDPAQLEKYASYFVADVEFYHDNAGVTCTRDEMIANTAKHACGNSSPARACETFAA